MSLEDPPTVTALPATASAQVRLRRSAYPGRIAHMLTFAPVIDEKHTVMEEDPDMSWHERLVIRCARLNKAWLSNVLLVLGTLLLVVVLVMPVRYLLGYREVVPAFVISDMREVHSLSSPSAYIWLNNKPDARVSQHVIEARAGGNSSLLVLVGSGGGDEPVPRSLSCQEMVSQHAHVELLAASTRHLQRQSTDKAHAVCGPQLGFAIQYIGFRDAGESAPIVHMFSPLDDAAATYDALDADRLERLGVGLNTVSANQNYRYNAARGTFTLLRRTKLSIVGTDATCQRNRVGLKGSAAVDAEECLDLLRGIDVARRARMQFDAGVILNSAAFGAPGP